MAKRKRKRVKRDERKLSIGEAAWRVVENLPPPEQWVFEHADLLSRAGLPEENAIALAMLASGKRKNGPAEPGSALERSLRVYEDALWAGKSVAEARWGLYRVLMPDYWEEYCPGEFRADH